MKFRTLPVVAAAAALAAATLVVAPVGAHASTAGTLVGACSKDWKWFDTNVGPMQIYRYYDTGFHFPTWQQTAAYQKHPDDSASPTHADDYSFDLPPQDVANGTDDQALTTFIASTPTNITLSNYHEPEQEIEAGQFTFQQFMASTTHLAYLVHRQNLVDGGDRTVSVVLMVSTFTGLKGRSPNNYWPTSLPTVTNPATGQPVGEDFQDLVAVDAYALPHNTGTPGVPLGYTDGVSWKTGAALLKPVLVWANSHHTRWAVSELGYLEDVHSKLRKAGEIVAAYNYAAAGKATPTTKVVNPAMFVEYWDSKGGRADWELRYNNPPVPSISAHSNAAVAWKTLAGN